MSDRIISQSAAPPSSSTEQLGPGPEGPAASSRPSGPEKEKELAALREQMAQIQAQLRVLLQLKKQTVHKVSHGLRTPLVTALGYLEMLIEGRLGKIPPKAESRMQVALNSLQHLSQMIDDIVVYNRLLNVDDERLGVAPGPVDPAELLQQCAQDFIGTTRREMASIHIDIPPSLPHVVADARLLRQIVGHLLENADRYSGARSQIWLAAEESGCGTVRFIVRDDGVGMAVELQEKVLELGTGEPGPLGFGLRLVQAVLRAHGQELKLESKVGEGTTASFELPVC